MYAIYIRYMIYIYIHIHIQIHYIYDISSRFTFWYIFGSKLIQGRRAGRISVFLKNGLNLQLITGVMPGREGEGLNMSAVFVNNDVVEKICQAQMEIVLLPLMLTNCGLVTLIILAVKGLGCLMGMLKSISGPFFNVKHWNPLALIIPVQG